MNNYSEIHSSSPQAPSSLRRRILASIWTIPAIVLPIVAATLAWFAYDEYRQTIEQEYRLLEAHARIAEGQLSGLLRNVRQLVNRIAEERPTIPPGRLDAYQARLAEHNREIPEIRTLAIVNAAGRVEIAVNPVLKGFDGSKREYFTAHRDGVQPQNFLITRPYKSAFGDYSVGFTVAMRDDQRHLLGVVVAGVNYKYFESVMHQIKPEGKRSLATIFNQNGDVLYRLPNPDKSVGASIADGAAFKAFRRSGQPMTRNIGVGKLDGIERIFVLRAIAGTSLGIAVARPLDDILAPWRQNLVLRALMFVFAAAVTFYLARIAHRRQNEVLAAKEFSEQLIATANVMVVGLDTAGRVIIFNQTAEQVSGYRRDEMLGRDWFESAVPRERYPQACEIFGAAHRTGEIPHTYETPILTKTGEERIVAWQNSAIRKHGKVVATMSFGIDVTERSQVEQARHKEEVSRRLVAAQEEERRRLAVELHDRTGPNLDALSINFKRLAGSLPAPVPEAQRRLLTDTSTLFKDTIAAIRAVSIDFRPPLLDYAGFWPALQGYASRFSQRTGIAVHAEESELPQRLAPEIETNLFHIAQEALANCARHAAAKTIHIGLKRSGEAVEFAVADDGTGFDPQVVLQVEAQNQGLATMRQRAEFIGGKFSLDTAPGKGTRVAVEFATGAIPAAMT